MLLKHINTPGIEIGRLFRKVRIDVMTDSGERQVPWESSSLTGDFYFNAMRGIAVEERPTVEPEKPLKETQEYASISPEVLEPKVVARDRHFVKYDNGLVFDTKTGLEWYAGPDESTNWYEAKRWVENLSVAGGGWKMPTIKELKTLYQKGTGIRNMTPLLKTTGWIWSGETKDSSSAWGFNFNFGSKLWTARDLKRYGRGYAVRSRR